MAVPYSLNTLVTALIAVANAHRSHPIVPALHAKLEEAKKEQRKRGRAAGGVSRKTLYTYISQLAGFLHSACPSHGEMIASEAAAAFIAAEPRCAHRYYSSIPSYQFHALVRFITERNIADVRALVSGRNASGPDDLYYQLYDFIGREPPHESRELYGHYYAYRPSLSAAPYILKSLVQIERKPSGAVGYLERMEYSTKDHGSRRQLLEGYVLQNGLDIFVITRDTNTAFMQTFYLDMEFRDADVPERAQIRRMKGRYNGITFNVSPARIFSTGIFLEAATDPACRRKDLREESILDLKGIGLHHPDDVPAAIVARLERFGYQRPRTRKQSTRTLKK